MAGRRVWIITDGRPGNVNPATALARAMQGLGWAPAQAHVMTPKPWAARLPASVWSALPASRRLWPWAGYVEGPLPEPWPDLVISAGRRAAPAAAAMRSLSRGRVRAVQVLDPRMGLSVFDAVVTPRHDGRTGANVVSTLGSPSVVTPQSASEAAAALPALAALPTPRLAVMIGGPSRAARWTREDAGRLVEAAAASARAGWSVIATPSRRSPPGLAEALRAAAPGAFVWDGTGANPYPGMLGLASAALVSSDSVNMASEAASAGLPVMVLDLPGLSPKLRRFHDALEAAGSARPWRGHPESWSAPPLREAERAAEAVHAILSRGGADEPARPAADAPGA